MNNPDDCPHPALRIELGQFVCRNCGLTIERHDTPADSIKQMRAIVADAKQRHGKDRSYKRDE